jgi:alpha-tubulin suppressor-like RCC1 family protein
VIDRRFFLVVALAMFSCKRHSAKPSTPVLEIAAGATTTCARHADGTISCWGEGTAGLIPSDAKPESRTSKVIDKPRPYHPFAVATKIPRGATQIALGAAHACARLADGNVSCWGSNGRCELALGAVDQRPDQEHAPTPIRGVSAATSVVAGAGYTCVLVQGGRVRCWGTFELPAQCNVEDAPVTANAIQIAVGSRHACALMNDRTVSCWGWNKVGQLGRGDTTEERELFAVRVAGLSDVEEIAAGGDSTCARRKDGTVSCWGANNSGKLGVGDREPRAAPTPVTGLRDVTRIAVGTQHACAITADSSVRCWGLATAAGSAGEKALLVPAVVAGLTGVTEIALGGNTTDSAHSCALSKDGAVRCWGANAYGQLGNDSTVWGHVPVDVLF